MTASHLTEQQEAMLTKLLNGVPLAQACCEIGVTERTARRWRTEHPAFLGVLQRSQVEPEPEATENPDQQASLSEQVVPEAPNAVASTESSTRRIIQAWIDLLELVRTEGGSFQYRDESIYSLLEIPQHLWPILLHETSHTVLDYRLRNVKNALAELA